jgi:hypothetical protein
VLSGIAVRRQITFEIATQFGLFLDECAKACALGGGACVESSRCFEFAVISVGGCGERSVRALLERRRGRWPARVVSTAATARRRLIDICDLLTFAARRAQGIDDAPRCVEQQEVRGASGELRDERPIVRFADRII